MSSACEFRGDNNQQSYLVNYDYDVFGSRYQKQSHNSGNPFTQIWTEDSDITQATNRFASNLTYDDAGNILTDQKFRQLKFQYDANNRQKQSSNLDDTGAVVSVYDAGGQRVATQVGNSLTNVLVYDATGKLVAEYGSPASTGGTQYLFSDQLGTPRAVTNSSGAVISRHDYLPFGEELNAGIGMRSTNQGYSEGDNARQKYAGMESDDATGMSHTLWRQYDPSSGRWTAPDPYGGSLSVGNPQSFNRYSYVSNDPVNQLDPSGLSLQDMGVLQTSDPAEAESAEDLSLHNLQMAVNAQYASAHGGSVSYDKSGHATFIGKYSAVNYFRRTLGAATLGAPQELSQRPGVAVDAGAENSVPNTLFPTADAAAVNALQRYNPLSRKSNHEYAGSVCKVWAGAYTYSTPIIGTEDSSYPNACPDGTKEAGIYHTHAAARFSGDGELFSLRDRQMANGLRTINGATFIIDPSPVYLATPTGVIKRFDPNPRSSPLDGRGTPVFLKQRTQ